MLYKPPQGELVFFWGYFYVFYSHSIVFLWVFYQTFDIEVAKH